MAAQFKLYDIQSIYAVFILDVKDSKVIDFRHNAFIAQEGPFTMSACIAGSERPSEVPSNLGQTLNRSAT